MCCDDNQAPAPDPQMGAASVRQIELSEKQYADYMAPGGDRDWMRSASTQALGIARQTADASSAMNAYQLGVMKQNDSRYWDTAVPFEDGLLKDVNRFDSQGYKDNQIRSAQADVQSSYDSASRDRMITMERMGINPSSGRMADLQGSMDIAKANAMASASNKTRMAADQVGLSTKMSMYGGMKGLAGLGNANASLAGSALGTGLNAGNSMTGAVGASLGANNANFNSSMSGMSAGISGLGSYNQLQQSAAKINADNDPFKTIMGAAAGMGASYFSGGFGKK